MDSEPSWVTLEFLGLSGVLAEEWDAYTTHLYATGIVILESNDCMVLSINKYSGDVTMKLAYLSLLKQYCFNEPAWWFKAPLKVEIPSKIKYFIWFYIRHRILNWDSLQQRGLSGLGRCLLCLIALEMT